MAVKIRLMRVGKKKQPSYRVVVADGRSPRDGRFIEIIGQYGPRQEPSHVVIDDERALHWLGRGAQPTVQVQKLLAQAGIWAQYEAARGKAVKVKPPKPAEAKAVDTAAAAGDTAAPAADAAAPADETPADAPEATE